MPVMPERNAFRGTLASCLITIGVVGFAAGAQAAQPGDADCCPPSTPPVYHPPYGSRYYGAIDPYPIGYYPYASAYGSAGYALGYYPYSQPYAAYAVPYAGYGPYAPYGPYGGGYYPYRAWPWAYYGLGGWGWAWGWGFPYPLVF
jgi:hypothetical protein